jgi:hypothetical protein
MSSKRTSTSAGNEPEYIAAGHRPDTVFVALADGTRFPESVDINVLVRDERSTIPVRVSLEVRDGFPIVTEVTVFRLDEQTRRVGITPTALHDLNFGKVFDAAVEQASFMGVGYEDPPRDKAAAQDAARRAAGLARRRVPFSDDLLAQVTTIVKENPYNPRKTVAATLHMSDRTSSRWIAEAKRRGLLDERGSKSE